ncbi:MAG: hypothetical protein QOE65_2021 [Solirubrobacteraceae bacterium]|jgi:hypothetical protein|nr:hypothetical protein [Solirubrobacteraceae bacterium]
MPGPITHLIVERRLGDALRAQGAPDLADLLDPGSCSAFPGFGSIGPDFLFFSVKEYSTDLQDLVNFVFGVYDDIEPLIDFYDNTVGKLVKEIEQGVRAIDMALLGGVIGQVQQTFSSLQQTLNLALAKVATQNIDFFTGFKPRIQDGRPESDWFWFDLLHYRRTGQFCSAMWQLAGNDDELRAYCLGYASHIATDVVGHPFVNGVVGGPYRMHWHRHKLVENWIDAHARSVYGDDADTIRCLQRDADSEGHVYVPGEIGGSNYYLLCEFDGSRLPPKLSKLFATAMQQVYAGSPGGVPQLLTAADVDACYRLWFQWFERSTTIGTVRKPAPQPPPGSAASQLVNDYLSNFPPPPSLSPPSGGFSAAAVLAALAAFADYVGKVADYTLGFIGSHASDILNLGPTTAKETVLWLLYQAQKAIWEWYESLRFALVLGAYLFPEAGDLTRVPWGSAFVNTASAGATGGGAPSFAQYPLREGVNAAFGATDHQLPYPTTGREGPFAEPMPQPWYGRTPEVFISDPAPLNAQAEKLDDCIHPYGTTDRFTHFVDGQTWTTPQRGGAIDFSARLIVQRLAAAGQRIPNFNLDGDRGYGWKTWRAANPKRMGTSKLASDYVDAP